MMKFVILLLTLFAVASAKPAFTPAKNVLQIRGGASLGPIDADLVNKVGATSLALYMGGSASKWVAGQTGGSAPAITDVCTNELISTVALVNAIATAAYFIGDTGYGADETTAVLLGAVLVHKALAAGGLDKTVDVIMDNKVLALFFVLKLYVTFV